MDKEVILGTVILVIALLGMLHPLLVLIAYNPATPITREISLVKTIYEALVEPRLQFTGKQYTITIPNNTSVITIKARSSIVRVKEACGNKIMLKDLANVPSEYMVSEENNTITITIIGYYAIVSIPCNTVLLKIDSRITYLSLEVAENNPSILDVYLLGSIARIRYDKVSKPLTITLTLEDSLLELLSTISSTYNGEGSIELKATSSIAYLNISTPRDTRLRLVKLNVGGIVEVLINGSRVIEPYYIDEGYYESKTRLHIGVTSIGSGVRVDILRRSR